MKLHSLFSNIRGGIACYKAAYKVVLSEYTSFNRAFIMVSSLFIITSLVSGTLPFILKMTAESFYNSMGSFDNFFLITMTYAICWTFSEVLKNLKGIFSAGVLARSGAALTEASLNALLSASYASQRNFDAAILYSNINRGSSSFSGLTNSVFWTLIPVAVEISTAVFFLYQSLGALYSVIFLIAVLFLIFLAVYISVLSRSIHSDIMNAQNNVSSYAVSRLNLTLDMRVNAAHAKERRLRSAILQNYISTISLTNRRMGILLSFQSLTTGILLAGSVLALIFYKNSSALGSGDFVMVAGYIGILTMQLRMVAASCIDIQRQVVYLTTLLDYINMPEDGFVQSPDLQGRGDVPVFEVCDVRLTHTGAESPSNLSFKVFPGEMLAFSAPSGFGKSTILTYLLGLHAPKSGQVCFHGSEVNTGLSNEIISQVAFVPQKAGLIPGTVRDNLLYGSDECISDNDLMPVLHLLALIDEENIISARNLLDRAVDTQGSTLSGGEIQRICIARALLRKKNIVVLDEPTASINEDLAISIILRLREYFHTIIITTHNPRIVALADRSIIPSG